VIVFTVAARRVIERSFMEFGDDQERAIWREWVETHPMVRTGPDSPTDDGTGPMPQAFAVSCMDVLAKKHHAMGIERQRATDDITYIRSIALTIKRQAFP
jgi:hypothetical protein